LSGLTVGKNLIALRTILPSMPEKPQIVIDPHALQALRIWADLENKEPGSLLSDIILKSMPSEVKEVLESKESKPIEALRVKKLSLSQDRVALGRIRDLWNQTPRPTIQEIAKEIGYPTDTVAENIKKMRHREELQ
jgi:hypothetical protein